MGTHASGSTGPNGNLLQVDRLSRYFDVSPPLFNRLLEGIPRQILKAVDDVSFAIKTGRTFSLVGESGCGKSTVARVIMGLYPSTSGSVRFDGVDLSKVSKRSEAQRLRRRMQMIFQDPFASLNPRWRVRSVIAEPIRVFRMMVNKNDIHRRVDELLRLVGLTSRDGDFYPHEFSGGQRQRISIARALASKPDFLVCDEPTSALDVSVQAQILNLMKNLQREFGLTYLFISHNLAVVYHVSDFVGVMYLGRLMEVGAAKTVFRTPQHPYTRMLLDAIPDLDMTGREHESVAGEIGNPINPVPCCAFHPRCPYAEDCCRREIPQLTEAANGVTVACHGMDGNRVFESTDGRARQ
jgi:peptide/nickel transport system ATP-binding protein